MTDFNMTNKALVEAGDKISPAKQNARVKCVIDKFTLTAEMVIGDEYLMESIPESATILDAYVLLPASLGTTGILQMGLKSYVNKDGDTVAEDNDSLVQNADGGGQAALKRAALGSVALHKEVGLGGAQPFLYASEASDAGIGDEIIAAVFYSLP